MTFLACVSLETIKLAESVIFIGANAFDFCKKLKTIYSASTTPPDAVWDTFSEAPKDVVVYVPVGTMKAYSEANGWKYFWDFREMTQIRIHI